MAHASNSIMSTFSATTSLASSLLEAADELSSELNRLDFAPPVTHVYNPLDYARKPYATYLQRFATSHKRILFLGMNPGPWGMVQTGIPFGEIEAVRDWLKIDEPVGKPSNEHPKRLVEGFECKRSEVSGKRLWGLFADTFQTPEAFFEDHLVINYCPLTFMEESGRNRTPDKLPAEESRAIYAACDRHLKRVVELLQPKWLIGIGAFAESRCKIAAEETTCRVGRILHPSPASPLANRGWAEAAAKQLHELGAWTEAIVQKP